MLVVLIHSDVLIILLEHRYAIACSGVYVDRAYNAHRLRCIGAATNGDRLQQLTAAVAMFLNCYIRVHFASTPTSILNLTISQESKSFTEFNDVICVGKYCQLFTHRDEPGQAMAPPRSTAAQLAPTATITVDADKELTL